MDLYYTRPAGWRNRTKAACRKKQAEEQAPRSSTDDRGVTKLGVFEMREPTGVMAGNLTKSGITYGFFGSSLVHQTHSKTSEKTQYEIIYEKKTQTKRLNVI